MKERLARVRLPFHRDLRRTAGGQPRGSASRNFYRAFPEASIDFKVNRDEAQPLAGQFLASQQDTSSKATGRPRSLPTTMRPRRSWSARSGWSRPTASWARSVRLWRWAYRWFRPLQKEEYNVEITPRGELVGFEHELPEDAARPAATPEQARAPRRGFPAHARAAATRRRSISSEATDVVAAASRGPHLHLEGARFRAARCHISPRSRGARQ